MIGIPSAPAASTGDSLPVVAAASPAGLAGADSGFDDVFRQLAGALLATSAVAGGAGELEGELREAVADEVEDDISLPAGGLATPVAPAPPTEPVVIRLGSFSAGAAPGQEGGTDAGVEHAGSTPSGSTATEAAAPRLAATRGAFTGGVAPPAREALADGAPSDVRAEDAGSTTVPFEIGADLRESDRPHGLRETAANERTAESYLTAPADQTVARAARATSLVGTDGRVTATPRATTAAPAARPGPTPQVEPASAPMLQVGPASAPTPQVGPAAAPTPTTTPVATPAVTPEPLPEMAAEAAPAQAVPSAATATTPARTLPANAERLFALQRALARQTSDTAREPATAATPAVTQGDQHATAQSTSYGAAPGGDGQAFDRRQGRAWNAPQPAGSAIGAAATAGLTAAVTAADAGRMGAGAAEGAPTPGLMAGAAWRAAFASGALAEGFGATTAAVRAAGVTTLAAASAPAFVLPVVADSKPVVDTAAAPVLDPATAESVQAQIVKSIRLQWSGGLGEARVTLKPEYLGEVVAAIKVEQGVVTATLQADTREVRRWLETHTATLRDALIEHGLKLERLTVSEPDRQTAHGDRQSKPRHRQPEQHRQPARHQTADTDTPFDVSTE